MGAPYAFGRVFSMIYFYRLAGLMWLLLLSACHTLSPLSTLSKNGVLNTDATWYVFSNGALLSLNLPRHDWRLNQSPELDLEGIELFGEVFMLRADQPNTFSTKPRLFEMAMNVMPSNGDAYASYLVQRESSNKRQQLVGGGLRWECDHFEQVFSQRAGRRWVCVAEMSPSPGHMLLVYGKVTPWVEIDSHRLDHWEATFFNSLATAQLSLP